MTRDLITNSSKYGITEGSYRSEWLELTATGKTGCSETEPPAKRLQARFDLAIASVKPFAALYAEYSGKRLAVHEVMSDFLQGTEHQVDHPKECIDIFVVNCKDLGLLRIIAGAETLIPIAQATEEAQSTPLKTGDGGRGLQPSTSRAAAAVDLAGSVDWDTVCFYLSPIGEDGSEQRKHSDLFMSSLVGPAVESLGLRVVRADHIGQVGMITTQVLEHIRKARLAIADLSLLNPNVFYEMALRHAARLPIVQLIRKLDRIPFDINQVRTVVIDTSDIYSLVPKIETYRSEIATQARNALEDPEHAGNPITVFYPAFFH